jgi:hypothetical protein
VANEIVILRPDKTGQTNLFATLTLASASNQGSPGQWWSTSGTPAFEAFTVAHWGNYAVALAETPASSGVFVGSVPSGINTAGLLAVTAWQTSGGTPTTDTPLSYPTPIDWTGSAVATVASRYAAGSTVARVTLVDVVTTLTGNTPQTADAGGILAKTTISLSGVVAASPPPTANVFTVTLDSGSALGSGTTAAVLTGLYLTFAPGANNAPRFLPINIAVVNSTTSVALTFAPTAFPVVPVAGEAVRISG